MRALLCIVVTICAFLAGYSVAATDVLALGPDVKLRDGVPVSLGLSVPFTQQRGVFSGSAFGLGRNIFASITGGLTLRPTRTLRYIGDKTTDTLRCWYGLWAGYVPGQLEVDVNHVLSLAPVLAAGIGIDNVSPVFTSTQTSSDPTVEPVSNSYTVPSFNSARRSFQGQVGLLAAYRGLGAYVNLTTRLRVNFGLAFVVGPV